MRPSLVILPTQISLSHILEMSTLAAILKIGPPASTRSDAGRHSSCSAVHCHLVAAGGDDSSTAEEAAHHNDGSLSLPGRALRDHF